MNRARLLFLLCLLLALPLSSQDFEYEFWGASTLEVIMREGTDYTESRPGPDLVILRYKRSTSAGPSWSSYLFDHGQLVGGEIRIEGSACSWAQDLLEVQYGKSALPVSPDFWFLEVPRTHVRLRCVDGATMILYSYQPQKKKSQ